MDSDKNTPEDVQAETNEEARPQEAASAAPSLPDDAMILLPMRNLVLFPGMILPVGVARQSSVKAAQEAARNERPIGLLLQKSSETDKPGQDDLHRFGTVADILRYVTGPDGSHHLICRGVERFRILEYLEGFPFHAARVERIAQPDDDSTEIKARAHHLRQQALEALELLPETPAEAVNTVQNIKSPAMLSDLVTGLMDIGTEEKQQILETLDIQERLDKVIQLLARRIEVLRLSQEISEQTKETMDQRQREFLLREQLKTIQKELGETDSRESELEELSEAIEKAQMPEEVEKQARKELKRLRGMPEAAAEASMVRTYLEWLTELPWGVLSEEAIDIEEARKILDEDHYDLDKVKRRILEHLAVTKLNPTGKSPILCFIGPPGVGKTSLGQSIARATGRKFIRQSLGGIHDESEIRGHRRTYVGALPGNIIQGIRKAGTRNPVFMLDEVDKLGVGFHGDPSSALLEVLDPEQNSTFRDTYLAVPFDLSRVMFIATANVLDTIPGPLRDRMEMIELPGYTSDEKVQIARRYLVDRQLKANGVKPDQVEITDEALYAIVRDYTRESGCRNLEREIGSAIRWCAVRIAEGKEEHIKIDAEDLARMLGPRKFENELAMRTSIPGVATGLAWTPTGGNILFIEASRVPGKGNLILTGHLGDVMKESAQAALSLVKGRVEPQGLEPKIFDQSDIHVHVPAGAIPKDGPSAGLAMFTALASLLTKRTVRSDIAMTGEISLRGLVLPVGGIKEKVVGAVQAGIEAVMLPARNRKDLEEIPEDARSKLKFHWIEHVDQALEIALEEGERRRRPQGEASLPVSSPE
ncbi:MAG: endopeptidase La [Candidatus Eisenbacteria bacterium]|nr:endopeptidase La [Candidatus Eisenbacteria bacterium]